MNHIQKLSMEAASGEAATRAALAALDDFRVFLSTSTKFQGVDADGDRRDWIATGDVLRWINQAALQIVEVAPVRALARSAPEAKPRQKSDSELTARFRRELKVLEPHLDVFCYEWRLGCIFVCGSEVQFKHLSDNERAAMAAVSEWATL